MSSFNLLPPELTVGSSSLKISRLLRRTNYVLGSVMVVSLLLLTGAALVFSTQARGIRSAQKEIEVKISALKETEQRLVLIKDRLEKISRVLSGDSSNIDTLIKINDQNLVVVKEAEIKKDKSRIEVGSTNLEEYSQFLESLIADESIKEIELSAFTYNRRSGYNSEFGFIYK